MTARMRSLAWGGVGGPVAFALAWSILGARTPGYSPVEQPISRLAAAGATTQPAMTAGLLAFGCGVSLYAAATRTALSRTTAVASLVTAAATVGIAALPLDGPGGDEPHAAAAGIAYAALAATQLAGAHAFHRQGRWLGARLSLVAGVATAVALAASAAGTSRTGLLQRTGLTIGDAWIVGTSLWMLRASRAAAVTM